MKNVKTEDTRKIFTTLLRECGMNMAQGLGIASIIISKYIEDVELGTIKSEIMQAYQHMEDNAEDYENDRDNLESDMEALNNKPLH